MKMTKERIAEARARCGAATPGPWKAYTEYGFNGRERIVTGAYDVDSESEQVKPYQVAMIEGYSRGHPTPCAQRKLDAAFIAAARTDLPDALDALEAAMAVVEAAREHVAYNCGDADCDECAGGDDNWVTCVMRRLHDALAALGERA